MVVLLNWLVQGLIVALVAAAGLRVISSSRARARYAFVWAASLLVVALPAIPLVSIAAIEMPVVDLPTPPAGPVVVIPRVWWTAPAIAMGCWIVWAGVHALRLVRGARALGQLKRRGITCPSDVLARLPHWSRVSATGRPSRVILSNRVHLAAVVGCGSPVIAITPRLVEQLTDEDLDRVLVHEWAHVQRFDDVAQFVQRLMRALVGWHPAAWWLERQMEFEREAACDQIAVSVTGSAKRYATCLTTLAALPQSLARPVPGLAALSPSGLGRRLVRILVPTEARDARPRNALTIGAVAGLIAIGVAVGHVQAVASAPASPTVSTAPFSERAALSSVDVSAASMAFAAAASNQQSLPRRAESGERVKRMRRARGLPVGDELQPYGLPTPAVASVPLPATSGTIERPLSPPPALQAVREPINSGSAPLTADARSSAGEAAPAPWTAGADAGTAMGRRAQQAGVSTGRFFSRLGKRIAHSF